MSLALRSAATAVALGIVAAPLAAQGGRGAAFAGAEYRSYSFESSYPIDRARQFAIPFGVAVPFGPRFSIDIGTAYAKTTVRNAGGEVSFDHLTDTQLRAAYVFGRDAFVATVMVNLPTGPDRASVAEFQAAGIAASNFLSFPVSSYSSGTSVTTGLAAATRLGSWNLGIAGSVRLNGEYQPFTEAGASFDYKPGFEGRIRLGADRLIGRSRLTFGGTFSTFGNDELTGAGAVVRQYGPGNRFIGEIGLAAPIGQATLNAYLWDYYRAAGDTGGSKVTNKENVLVTGAAVSIPLSPRVRLEPLLEGRFWSPQDGSGHLLGAGLGLSTRLTDHFDFVPSARYDTGKIPNPAGEATDLTGWAVSAFIRYSF